jgi:hypothetical protein
MRFRGCLDIGAFEAAPAHPRNPFDFGRASVLDLDPDEDYPGGW